MNQQAIRRLIAVAIISLLDLACGAADLLPYESRYYTIYTDLAPEEAREACIRMTRMAEEYHNRTRGFAGAIEQRMPFYLYKKAEDYYATGAPQASAGYFNGLELVARADDPGSRTWHVVQHEGFHQFAHSVIRGELPPWINEGLAEYFGEGVFTGDSYITGIIPQWRLERIRKRLASGQFKPLPEMMNLTDQQWKSELTIVNYDQGWSMVQFLAHGDNGKYQQAFGAFMAELAQGQTWQAAWEHDFGDTVGFEQRWREFWTRLPDNPTADLYVKANVAAWTSYLARSFSQKQSFRSFEELREAAQKGQLKSASEDWLPPSLLAETSDNTDAFIKEGCSYKLITAPGQHDVQIVCRMADGREIAGKFTIRNGRVGGVSAEIISSRSNQTIRRP